MVPGRESTPRVPPGPTAPDGQLVAGRITVGEIGSAHHNGSHATGVGTPHQPDRFATAPSSGRSAMTAQLLAAALLGVLAGPWLRGLIVAHAVGYRQPLRTTCPLCGATTVTVTAYGVLAVAPAHGRCPRCRHPIGPVPGTIEAIAAVVLALVARCAPTPGLLVAWTIFALLGIALAGIDLAVHRLPDELTVASSLIVLACAATTAILTHRPGILLGTVLGALALGGWYGIAVRRGMGRGDAQLAIAIGAALGWYRFVTVLWATALTYLIGATTVLILLAAKRIQRRQPIPLGVFLLLGALAAIILATRPQA